MLLRTSYIYDIHIFSDSMRVERIVDVHKKLHQY